MCQRRCIVIVRQWWVVGVCGATTDLASMSVLFSCLPVYCRQTSCSSRQFSFMHSLIHIQSVARFIWYSFFGQLKVILRENGTKTVKLKFKTWFQRRHKSWSLASLELAYNLYEYLFISLCSLPSNTMFHSYKLLYTYNQTIGII